MATEREIWISEQPDDLGDEGAVTVSVFDGASTSEYRDVLIGEKVGTPDVGTTAVSVHDGRKWVRLGDADTGDDEDEWLANIADILEAEYEKVLR